MRDTYSRIYIHFVFAVAYRHGLIDPAWEEELYQYITGIIKHRGQKLMVINGMPDHIHLLLGIQPDCLIPDLMRDIKANSSRWINEKGFVKGKFQWQTGYGAFSISDRGVGELCTYIERQKQYHAQIGMREEYIAMLKEYGVEFYERYIFEEPK